MPSQLGRIRGEGFSDSHMFDAPIHTRVMTRGVRPAPEVPVTHVQRVEAEYRQHFANWELQARHRPPHEYDRVVQALELRMAMALRHASEMDAQEAAKASA